MTDYATFTRGAKSFPLPVGSGKSALRLADPFLFYALEFIRKVIETHVGGALLELAGDTGVERPVAMSVPFDPVPHLTSTHFKFPLLAVYRRDGSFETHTGGNRRDLSAFEIAYILPPADGGVFERVVPFLTAIRDVLDDRIDLGFDPSYTPTGGTAGQTVWVDFAGAEQVKLTNYEIGAIQGAERSPWAELLFYTLFLSGRVAEKAGIAADTFETTTGANVALDLSDSVEDDVVDFVELQTFPAPTLTVATPNTGTKAGGTLVTLTGTGFRALPAPAPQITFGGAPATAVVVTSATTVQCRTPAHTAYPSDLVDVEVTNDDGQSATLIAGFTFTSP